MRNAHFHRHSRTNYSSYEEGDWTQFKEAPVSEFIQTTDPIAMLGSLNKLSFEQTPNGNVAIATIDKLPETTQEIRNCCADLKVLGRADFKRLLRWRLKVRDIFGFSSKKKEKEAAEAAEAEEVAEVESMDDEMKVLEEMERLEEQDSRKKKKQRRQENEKKQKEIIRMQMNMTTPFEIGLEQAGPQGDESMFALKAIDKAGALPKIARGKMATIVEREKSDESSDEQEETTDEEEDDLERELDHMYETFVEEKSAKDAKWRAKRARKEDEDGEWHGFSDSAKDDSSDEELVEDDDSDTDDEDAPIALIKDLDGEGSTSSGLTKRASRFFDQDIFKSIDGLDGLDEDNEDSGIDVEGEVEETPPVKLVQQGPAKKSKVPSPPAEDSDDPSEETEGEDGIEEVKRDESQWEQDDTPMKNGRPDIDIITAEAMTLAHSLATGFVVANSLLGGRLLTYYTEQRRKPNSSTTRSIGTPSATRKAYPTGSSTTKTGTPNRNALLPQQLLQQSKRRCAPSTPAPSRKCAKLKRARNSRRRRGSRS